MRPLAVVLVLALCGCSRTLGPEEEGSLTPVNMPGHPQVRPIADPEESGGHAGRAPRRLTVAQLKESIQVTTGRQWSRIDSLAGSLGQADYALTNAESTEANLVFVKFLEDGAREVCLNAARDDLGRPDPAARMLWPEVPGAPRDFTTLSDEVVAANLSTLSLRFWGSPLERPEVERWTATFRTVAARAKAVNRPEQAWGAICVAMMTDPRFYTY